MLINTILTLSVLINVIVVLIWRAERKWHRDVAICRKMGIWPHD